MFIIILIILGLCFGSFINALVWRTHENIKKKEKLSIVKGRSICTKCKHTLGPLDLIPVLSWLFLSGKCRYCHKPISVQYPLVELFTVLIFVSSYIWWPYKFSTFQDVGFGIWLIILTGLIALALYDLKWKILPSIYIYSIATLSIILQVINILHSTQPTKALLNSVLAVLVGGGIFYVIYQVSQGKWIGGGDVRLGFLLGLLAGTLGRSILYIFLASIIGSIVGTTSIALKKQSKNSYIAFGPYLILGLILVQLFGHDILNWYQNTFFLNTF